MNTVINAAHSEDVSVLVVRNPRDEGDPDWQSQKCRSIVADLKSDDGLFDVMDLISEALPEVLLITVAPDRDLDTLQVEAGEVRVIQELLWRHAGSRHVIDTFRPSLDRTLEVANERA